MYVIADIEWVTTCDGRISPLQLAAVRVDESWNQINSYFTYIKPIDSSFRDWTQPACNGGSKNDFLTARSAAEVFSDILLWLGGDTLLWWLSQSKELFNTLAVDLLGDTQLPEAISISEYVQAFLEGQPHARSNVYTLAASLGVKTKHRLKHCSDNDVRVIRQLMQAIKYPQSELLNPVVISDAVWKARRSALGQMYIYDKSTNTIHAHGCKNISDGELLGYSGFTTAFKKGYKPCECCKSEYMAALEKRNRDIISRTKFNYLYTSLSNYFHKPTCIEMLSAGEIMGSEYYETAINSGRTPCPLCTPVPIDKPLWAVSSPNKEKLTAAKSQSKSVKKAIARQQLAQKERSERLNDASLSETQRRDIITLTQPSFAFWAAHGYDNFHLRNCPKLAELSELHGYRTYQEAVQAGRTPCKICKPTSKHDVVLSIPISNRQRLSESVDDLKEMCQHSGFPCQSDEEFFYLQTTVGKWKIDLNSYPVRLFHINLIVDARTEEYHAQPRVFLSLTDAFLYIKRHDESLSHKHK
ncbi:MAG: hypothetical protein ACI4JS_08560 [Oscillospiraceae bacterium]